MAATNSQQEFNFDDFRRYRDGEMSAQEQHNLEKRMLDESLVAEAYEGFLALKNDRVDYQSTLQDLREALEASAKPKRSKALWAYASAASIVLILGFYWLVFVLNKSTGNESVAFEMSIEKPEQTNAAEEPKLKEAPLPPTALKPLPQKALGNAPAIKPEPLKAIDSPQEEEKRLDTNLGEAIAAYDQEQISVVESIPASAPAAALPSQAPLSQSAAKVSRGNAAGSAITLISGRPFPLNGWESYQSYLYKNSLTEGNSDQVEVSFTVNPDSTLSAFSAKGNSMLNDKAIGIVKNGPLWVPAKSKGHSVAARTAVTLHFHNSN